MRRRVAQEAAGLFRLSGKELPVTVARVALMWLPVGDLGALCLTSRPTRALVEEALTRWTTLCIDEPASLQPDELVSDWRERRTGWAHVLAFVTAPPTSASIPALRLHRVDCRARSQRPWLNQRLAALVRHHATTLRRFDGGAHGCPAEVLSVLASCPYLERLASTELAPCPTADREVLAILQGCPSITELELDLHLLPDSRTWTDVSTATLRSAMDSGESLSLFFRRPMPFSLFRSLCFRWTVVFLCPSAPVCPRLNALPLFCWLALLGQKRCGCGFLRLA